VSALAKGRMGGCSDLQTELASLPLGNCQGADGVGGKLLRNGGLGRKRRENGVKNCAGKHGQTSEDFCKWLIIKGRIRNYFFVIS
jgi:hypothetical protein